MRVLALCPYPLEGPSARYRTYNFERPLARQGVTLDIRPFMTRELYFRWMRHRRLDLPTLGALLLASARRLTDLLRAGQYDAVWVHRQTAPAFHPLFDRLLMRRARRIVFDMDDSVFTEYPIDELLRGSVAATVGNSYLARYVELVAPQTRALVVPTVIDPEVYQPRVLPAQPRREDSRVTVGWIGTGASFRNYLARVLPRLAETCRAQGAELNVIASPDVRAEVEEHGARFTEWTLDGYLAELGAIDIGIMPLRDDDYVRGKCAFKLIEYGALGLPSVATDLGANREVVLDGETGFLAQSDEEFCARLTDLIRDADLRRRLGEAARARVLSHYTLDRQAEVVAELLRSLDHQPGREKKE
ncbi:Glycosyltransferase involved in cell wall bisynthesis [Deinococcus reticulitermitis]|uniref:Glycosyltransferase involved in cell wall bisynthesis n=1 Tax=Deinococcus reticulitermitis TaxID=856736 RepID=A0A1H7AM19_9DEIO|nr:glycosyltransferase family 4 protein [Deinococcus reticulitermitis]SEJ65634.1 Glycosyltransferase involved in cell wall bisynthesis [Deinococcus reticulitermitis]